jgi:hypothetical protein
MTKYGGHYSMAKDTLPAVSETGATGEIAELFADTAIARMIPIGQMMRLGLSD